MQYLSVVASLGPLRRSFGRLRALMATEAGRDFALIIVFIVFSCSIAAALDLNERLVLFALSHPNFEEFELEDLPFGLALVSMAVAWFAGRRWRQYRAEAASHERTFEQLRRTMEEAVAANQAKSQFLAAMSHELRTPLNAILGFSEIIKDQMLGPAVSAQYRDYAADIHTSGAALLSIISDILDMARSEAGSLRFEPEVVDISETLERVHRLIGAKAMEGGLKLEFAVEPGLTVWADAAKFRQALLNLAFNAVKFTPEGGRIRFSACRDGDCARIEIADTGIGMAEADIPRAFLPFQQIDNSLQRRFEGTGLGLPLAKRYVEMQHGTLELRSALGVGTTAIVRIPLALSQVEAAD